MIPLYVYSLLDCRIRLLIFTNSTSDSRLLYIKVLLASSMRGKLYILVSSLLSWTFVSFISLCIVFAWYSKYARYLVSYRPPHRVMGEYGYSVEPVTQILTSMFGTPVWSSHTPSYWWGHLYIFAPVGSGEGHTAYFYKRVNIPTRFNSASMPKVKLPARKGFAESDEEVFCDPSFLPAVTDAVSKVASFLVKTNDLLASHLTSARPTRTRRPRELA